MTDQEIEAAACELRRLYEAGATLDDILGGEAGRCWVHETCAGDLDLVRAAFYLVHSRAAFQSHAPRNVG